MKTGQEIINGITRRLKDKGIDCVDSAIIIELRSLTKYEISQLATFGDIDKWIRERNKDNKEEEQK